MDNRWKKTVKRSTRFSPVLMDMIKTECKCRRIDFSNYIRLAATAAMKQRRNENDRPHRAKATFEAFQAVFCRKAVAAHDKGKLWAKN